jgi:hypothetical protein
VDEDEAVEIDRLRAEVACFRAENADLRTALEQLEATRAALHHMLAEAREIRGGHRRRDPVQLLGEPSAGSA